MQQTGPSEQVYAASRSNVYVAGHCGVLLASLFERHGNLVLALLLASNEQARALC